MPGTFCPARIDGVAVRTENWNWAIELDRLSWMREVEVNGLDCRH